ncbi:hypothetical protein ACFQ60_00965 [Streptomyces zhihengii]|uniref:Uncharacterized protein n=1 Tax=Streptomyces zhihengii TaxID=1818004 RepID=A0ABS2V403_9ACTN|nr:hypothetical protein [Streptomyces zhihengii]MBM9624328.1 hypothetical protein [Streptomyces zhihengii]
MPVAAASTSQAPLGADRQELGLGRVDGLRGALAPRGVGVVLVGDPRTARRRALLAAAAQAAADGVEACSHCGVDAALGIT